MPGFDRSGPMGGGAMTGGKRGFCNTTDRERDVSVAGYGLGRGCRRGRFFAGGLGRGQSRGFGQGFEAEGQTVSRSMRTTSPPDELEELTRKAQNLEKDLQMIKKRMDDLQLQSQ